MNKNMNDISIPLKSTSSYTNHFSQGCTMKNTQLYGLGSGGRINSLAFSDVVFGYLGDSIEYNVELYGTGGFNSISFNRCDLSYASKSVLYIALEQTGMEIKFYDCYFDTSVPLIENFNYKGAKVSIQGSKEALQTIPQKIIMTTKNALEIAKISSEGVEANNLPKGSYNLLKNGDFSNPVFSSDWFYTYASAPKSFVLNPNTIHGNAIKLDFNAINQGLRIFGIPIPYRGVYTATIRLKKVSGLGTLKMSYAGTYPHFNIDSFEDGEELVLSFHGNIVREQGSETNISLYCGALRSTTLSLEILEVTLTQGTYMNFGVPLHPKANIFPQTKAMTGTTASRPTSVVKGFVYIDTTLNKIIWWNGTDWVDAMGTIS